MAYAGTEQGMHDTFGSTCHGAGRARSRNNSRNKLDYQEVLDALKTKGIAIRVASPKLVMEEAPESYKVSCFCTLVAAAELTVAWGCMFVAAHAVTVGPEFCPWWTATVRSHGTGRLMYIYGCMVNVVRLNVILFLQ